MNSRGSKLVSVCAGLAIALSLSACDTQPPSPAPTITPLPIVSSTPVEPPAPTPSPTPTSTPEVYITSYEFLGTGSANIVYTKGSSSIVQKVVTLPYTLILSTGDYRLDKPYLSAGASYTHAGQAVGCRITFNNSVVSETLPEAGTISAMCNNLG